MTGPRQPETPDPGRAARTLAWVTIATGVGPLLFTWLRTHFSA